MYDIKKININKIVNYMSSGCKGKNDLFTIGLELEHFIISKRTNRSIGFYGERGVEAILREIAMHYDKVIYSEDHIIGLIKGDYIISLEPAAQIEISIAPRENLDEISEIYQDFNRIITPILDKWDYELVEMGYQPKTKVDELLTIPKQRYRYMEKYFSEIGEYGKLMMKGTAATQVSIDYYSSFDFIKKYKVAYTLSPVFSLICDNSPYFESEKNEEILLRSIIWENVDSDRVDISKYLNYKDISFETYANFVYQVPLVFVEDNEIYEEIRQNAEGYYKNKIMSTREIEYLLSMVFPDARVKKYIEIRSADSMPFEEALSYAALIKGIFINIEDAWQMVGGLNIKGFEDVFEAKHSIIKLGINSSVYGRNVMDIIRELFNIGKQNLNNMEKQYLTQFMNKIEKKYRCEDIGDSNEYRENI